mgnify:CR=1 FL=1
MQHVVLHPTYFPNIAHFVAFVKADKVIFEVCDNYQKQTYRNRAYVYGANGKLLMNIPVSYTQKNRQLYKDVKISYAEDWQAQHWKTLQSAYRTSPFFEFYQDAFKPLFEKRHTSLLEYNFQCLDAVLDCLQMELNFEKTETFEKTFTNDSDLRTLVNARKEPVFQFASYFQVFADKHGFIANLSILDLLFNEGPNAIAYLKSQSIAL